MLKFRIDGDKLMDFISGQSHLVLTKTTHANNSIQKKAIKNKEDLLLEDRYSFHKDYVEELILKLQMYNSTKIEELYKSFSYLFNNKEDLLRVLFGNYLKSEDLHKRILSKLTTDILEQGGIKI